MDRLHTCNSVKGQNCLQLPPLIGVPNRAMGRLATLEALMNPSKLIKGSQACRNKPLDAVLAWGRKSSGISAERIANLRALPIVYCEDGFLRSMGLGPDDPPLSILIDDSGVHYDASLPSRLEKLINIKITADQHKRTKLLRSLWCDWRVSKYNHAPETKVPNEPFVLVVDQTAGDLSIKGGLAEASSFQTMLQAARLAYPQTLIIVKIHPDVACGRKKGHFSPAEAKDSRLKFSTDGGHPAALLERAEAVYVVSSQLGFEALLWGRPVHCFGMPFYAGWGLTNDTLQTPHRRKDCQPTLEQLVHACLIAYPRYIDPHKNASCTPEKLIRCIGLQRQKQLELPKEIEAFGFKPWKKPILKRFLSNSNLYFRYKNSKPTKNCGSMIIWGRQPGHGVTQLLQSKSNLSTTNPLLLRIEDGFLRSVGLGANLIEPISWVIDHSGIYYDSRNPSDLETFLANHVFTHEERERAKQFRNTLIATRLTKYNLKAPAWKRPQNKKRVILVPGQVESDASILYGTIDLRLNEELLRAVRSLESDAWIVYKPHPDVVAGLRMGNSCLNEKEPLWDELVENGSIEDIYDQVDAVHVLTSLAGFEAMLRGVEVYTWGSPFYAGWGLTKDRFICPRRERKLSIDELVYGALIHYPRYVSLHSGLFIEPEDAIGELLECKACSRSKLSWWQLFFRQWGRWQERILKNIKP
jgi:capsular polysaccharide export protein